MEMSELKDKNLDELNSLLKELRRKQFKLRLVKSNGEVNPTHEIRKTRRSIAQVLTVMSQQERLQS